MKLRRSRSNWLALSLQAAIVILYCVWVLSMPVFPSQDGPLHLYCVEVFRQLLAHHPGVYSQTYFINHYLPPYSLYYYALLVLGKVTTLEMADKLIVCGYFILLPFGLRSLMRATGGDTDWAPLLMTPVFISWPLMMGFVNYCIAIVFACFALALWCRNQSRPGIWPRIQFLLWLLLILFTHPVPWMFVLGFCFLDLALRVMRSWKVQDRSVARQVLGHLRLDLGAAVVGCLGYFYLIRFPSKTPPVDPWAPPDVPYKHQILLNVFDYLRTRGLTVFTGTSGTALVSRLGVTLVFTAGLLFSARYALAAIRSKRWDWPSIWFVFALVFLIVLPFVPVNLNGSFYFAWRLLLLLYLSVAIAASAGMAKNTRGAVVLALFAMGVSLINLGLAFRLISPTARAIASLRDAPVIESEKPGMLIRPAGATLPEGLSYNGELWAGANYFRQHNLVMFNTSWINLPIIPIKPRPERVDELDAQYRLETPMLGAGLFWNRQAAQQVLDRVGFVLAMRVNTPVQESPFADVEGSSTPGSWAAGWRCLARPEWKLCVPPGATIDTAQR
jgi:hypothetical protein